MHSPSSFVRQMFFSIDKLTFSYFQGGNIYSVIFHRRNNAVCTGIYSPILALIFGRTTRGGKIKNNAREHGASLSLSLFLSRLCN